MNSHSLGLEILDTSNENILKIMDISVYNADLGVTCPELLITAPGFQVSASISSTLLTQGFNLTLTACMLEIQTSYCDSRHEPLPDGVYAIRYSVAPNEYVYVEYNHLRIVKAMKRIDELLCQLDIADCEPTKDKRDRLKEISRVRDMLLAAKSMVEYCHKAEKGMAVYNYALKKLDKLDCKTCH